MIYSKPPATTVGGLLDQSLISSSSRATTVRATAVRVYEDPMVENQAQPETHRRTKHHVYMLYTAGVMLV